MEYFKFLWPENPIAITITVILISVFAAWAFMLTQSWNRLQRTKRELVNCYDVVRLTEAINTNTSCAGDETGRSIDVLVSRTNETIYIYADEKSIDRNGPVYAHMKALFEAGMFESRLDSNELIKMTTARIFKINTALRSILASFIVMGLLGTLFGLAGSLNYLPNSLKEPNSSIIGSQVSNQSEMILRAVENLFSHLGNAFAPSIWGTLLTIMGIGIYALYVHRACHPVKNLLDYLTNTVWIPQLIPTTTQRSLEALRQSQITMNQTLEATKTVANFAKGIEQDVSEFGSTLKTANRTLKTLSGYGDQMQNVVSSFGGSIGNLLGLQKEVQTLTNQFLLTVESHQNHLDASKQQISELQNLAKETFVKQGGQIAQLLAVIQEYESKYAAERERTDGSIKSLLDQSQSAIVQLEARNKEIIETLGKPLLSNLTDGLKAIEENSARSLAIIAQRLSNYDAPLQSTVERISEVLETVVRRTETLLEAIQRETSKANSNSIDHIKQVGELSSQIKILLEQLSRQVKDEQAQKDGSLENAIMQLNESVRILSRTSALQNQDGANTVTIPKKDFRFKRVVAVACIVLTLASVGGIGYWQYKMMNSMTEIQATNNKLVNEIKKLVQPVSAPPATKITEGQQVPTAPNGR